MRKLFIDDIRFPIDDSWTVVRSSQEGIDYLKEHGMPDVISFDHDLGGDDTSIIFINEMIEMVIDGKISVPSSFEYKIHSANPVGSDNIKGKMDSFLKHFGK